MNTLKRNIFFLVASDLKYLKKKIIFEYKALILKSISLKINSLKDIFLGGEKDGNFVV